MTGWEWWAGYDEDQAEGTYSIGTFGTREEAIVAGLRETKPGETFHIVEARSSTDMRYEESDFVPFVRARGHEAIVNGPAA